MFMKTIQIIIVLLMVGLPTMEAQNRLLVVKKTDGTTQEIPVKDIVEMTVEEYLPLKVNVSENEMTDPSASAKVKSTQAKAPIITTSTFSSFKMNVDGINPNTLTYQFIKGSGSWSLNAGLDKWPDNDRGKDLSFFAYNDGTYFQDTDGSFPRTYVQFGVSDDPWNQTDLLVASNKTSFYACNGTVNLTFDHACAAVGFDICMTKKLSEKLGGGKLTVNSVKLKNVINSGQYEFNPSGNDWTHKSGSGNYTLTQGSIEISMEQQALPCGYLFMIPQFMTSEDQVQLEIAYTITISGVSTSKTISIPLENISWVAGKKHTMSIKLNTSMIEL